MQREGPLDTLPRGTYKGRTVDYIIRNNPRYFMSCVKEWLDISPSQAHLFTLVTSGEIPQRYIKKDPPKAEEWTERDYRLYYSNQDILPNHDFEDDPPEWWEEFKEKSKGMTRPSQIVDLYRKYTQRDLQSILKEI